MNSIEKPYQYLDRNVEAKQKQADTAPVNEVRDLRYIENGMIEDTISLVNILDGTTLHSDRLLNGERQADGPFDAAIYLDKSARPVRQLTHAVWKSLSQEKEPRSLFLNIDKRPWLRQMGYDNSKVNVEDIDPAEVSLDKVNPRILNAYLARIRALYLTNPADFGDLDEDLLEDEDYQKKIMAMPTLLDGKKLAIIDEVKSSGNTLRISVDLIQRAIPDAIVEGMWWSTPSMISWSGGEDVDFRPQRAASVVPVWYHDSRESGRGVGDIDMHHSLRSPSKAQRIGRAILSAPERDAEGNTIASRSLSAVIRSDLDILAKRFIERQLVRYTPDERLNDDDYDHRIEQYYQEPADVVYKRWRAEQGR